MKRCYGVTFRELRSGDIEFLAEHLRKADRKELAALHGTESPKAILAKAVRMSSHAWVAEAEGEPVAVLGVAPIVVLEGAGAPWMLATDKAYAFPRALITQAREFVEIMLVLYPHLLNIIDARNTRSIRWLRRLGFTIKEPRPIGPFGFHFHPFEMRKESHV